ncbi:hypothetical protein IGS68_32460 (plasmid) [Skermanella sp. TT6]|uniref:Uncharacterized protein n=1 Tax=Skermanella cutis TaxID=2775420 RepID=A0ABX7BH89_9PROT|nr:hypothetical protein [Skermanella sp. TT6]QQP93727.1 hypothetical protein IGS68_32460 [Skermanella sp. TT6]
MAENANSIPCAVSRRLLFSVAAALRVAATVPLAAAAESPDPLAALLLDYREVGLGLRKVNAELDAAPARLPEWSPAEIHAFGLPDTMTPRPSLADLQEFSRLCRLSASGDEQQALAERHDARVEAWTPKRQNRKAWFRRSGAAELRRKRHALMDRKNAVGGALMALVLAPDFDRTLRRNGFDA